MHLILDLDEKMEQTFKMMCLSEGISYKDKVKELMDMSVVQYLTD